MLLEARDVTKAFGSFKAVDAASGHGWSRVTFSVSSARMAPASRPSSMPDRRLLGVDLRQGIVFGGHDITKSAAGSPRSSRARPHFSGTADL